jgi:hypothetical protein
MLYRFSLNIPYEEYLRFYRAESRTVQVYTAEGLSVRFPAEHLRTHVTHEGVKGVFELESSDTGNKFIALRRVV